MVQWDTIRDESKNKGNNTPEEQENLFKKRAARISSKE